jgi:uncharacterized protein (DUF58 family)
MLSPEKILLNLDWTVIRKLDGLLQGDYRSLFHGFGIDFAELREYQYSDDVRYIDWNVTARLQIPYIRQYMEDREITAWFLLDLSPSMDFGTVKTLKSNLLIEFVGILARLLTRHGNRVGSIFFSGKVEAVIPPLSSKVQVLRLIKDLQNQQHLKQAPPTNLTVLLDTALRVINRHSLVFIVSDFFSEPGWDKPLSVLAQRHEVLAVHLFDPREFELPDVGVIVMQDSETGEQLLINTHDAKFRDRFIKVAQNREFQLNAALHRSGIDILELSTQDDMAEEILRFATVRKQRKKAPASFSASSKAIQV